MALNLASGAGPVLSVNGAENLWLGTDWELASTPPGVEFEALMHLEPGEGSADRHFLRLAADGIGRAPLEWVLMGIRKEAAFVSVPGPGRNLEFGHLLAGTGLFPLLLLTLGLLSLALVRMPGALRGPPLQRLPLTLAAAALAAAFLFIPAARYRTAFFPAFLFLAASRPPSRREAPPLAAALLLLTAVSLLDHYPGSPRTGLTEVQAAQQRLERSEPAEALDLLHAASVRGYRGADLHNVAGASLMALGREGEGLAQFELALGITQDSPSLLRNYAVALWNTGNHGESVRAARRAIELDPRLSSDLAPILEWGRGSLP
jgi:tetratricopeptide (TPR) repeat protein